MTNFPCRQLFLITGFVHSKYDQSQNSFKVSKMLLIYGIILTVAIQSFNIFQIFERHRSATSYLYAGSSHEFMGNTIMLGDNIFWMIINWIYPVIVVVNREIIVKFMNDFMDYEMKLRKKIRKKIAHNPDKKIKTSVIIWFSIGCLIVPTCLILEGALSVFDVLIAVPISIDYIIGQLFEFVFLQKIRLHFSILRRSCKSKHGHRKLHEWLTLEMRLTKLAKLCARVFANAKVAFLLSANVLLAIYWFFNYDIIINVYSSILWQIVISTIFVLCHIWDKVSNEVSTTLFGIVSFFIGDSDLFSFVRHQKHL